MKSPLVQQAIMFGRERNQTGALIELKEGASGEYYSRGGRAKLVEEIWSVIPHRVTLRICADAQVCRPYIERANQIAPKHSRLAKSTLILVDPARPLPRTPKRTVPRSAAFKAYEREIEEMYVELEKDFDDADGVEPPKSWTRPEVVEAWIGKCVASILGHEVDASGDLFQQGMDR